MATTVETYEVNKDGVSHPFVDRQARQDIDTLRKRIANVDSSQSQALKEESDRAKNKERELLDSKVDKEQGKGLSSNDFTNEYKGKLDNPDIMQGATEDNPGRAGLVPAPAAGSDGDFLSRDGTFKKPHDTTYEAATQSKNGLMSKNDKKKLDAMDQEQDDVMACETVFNGNVITQTFGNGKVKTTTFNADGTISESIAKDGMDTINLKTTFRADGSISKVRL